MSESWKVSDSATILATLSGSAGALLAVYDGIAFEISGSRTLCMCPTIWHPGSAPSLFVGSAAAAVMLAAALAIGLYRTDRDVRRAAGVLLAASLVGTIAGDQFWIGTFLGIAGAIPLLTRIRSPKGLIVAAIVIWAVLTVVGRVTGWSIPNPFGPTFNNTA